MHPREKIAYAGTHIFLMRVSLIINHCELREVSVEIISSQARNSSIRYNNHEMIEELYK